jgi:hypothetical protein
MEGVGGALAEFDLTERCVMNVLNLWSSFQLVPLRPLVNVQDVYAIVTLLWHCC